MASTNLELRRSAILLEAHRLLMSPDFTKEKSSRAEGLLLLASELDTEMRHGIRLRRDKLTASEAELGMRTEDTSGLDETRQLFLQALVHGATILPNEKRALVVATDGSGGFLVPTVLSDRIFMAAKAYDPLAFDDSLVTVVVTDTGGSFSAPLSDDTSASSPAVAENQQITGGADIAFDTLALGKATSWKTSLIRVSNESLADAAFDVEALLTAAFGIRLGRGIAASFYSTLVGAATAGVTAGASSVSYENLCDLIDSVDAAYQASPKCAFLMRRATLTYLSKLKDSQSRPIFPIARTLEGGFELFGFPIRIAPSAAAIGSTNKSILFGDFSYFVTRFVRDSLRIQRKFETFAEYNQTAFFALTRCNAGLARPTGADSPIKYLVHA